MSSPIEFVHHSQGSDASPSVVWYIQPYAGGPGVGRQFRGYHLAREWQKSGVSTHIFCAANHHLLDDKRLAGSSETVDGIVYHFLGLPAYANNGIGRLANMMAFGRALVGYLRRKPVDPPTTIIYSSPHLFGVSSAIRLSRKHDSRFILEVRDIWPLSWQEVAGVSRWNPLVLWLAHLERRSYTLASSVVSLLPCAKHHMYARGLSEGRWRYIPNGIVVDHSGPLGSCTLESPPTIAAKKCKESGKRLLVYAGALGVPNDVMQLIDAIKSLNESERALLEVIIVGRGTQLKKIEKASIGLPVQVFLPVSKAEIFRILALSDGGFISLVESPLFQFGISPNKLFDYMVNGCTVISTIKAGNDPVAEANCGFSVGNYSDKRAVDLIRMWLALDDKELAEMGSRGRLWVEANHNYCDLASRYLDLIE